jgi:hypothetical protein
MRRLRRLGLAGSDVAFGWRFVEVAARVHFFMQHPDDLDYPFVGDAIVENMNRSPHLRRVSRTARISDVEAPDTWTKFGSLLRKRAFWLRRDLPHRGGENSGVPLPTLGAPPLGTCRKDAGEIDLRWASEPKPRHAVLPHALRRRRCQPFEIPFEIDVLNLREVAAMERIDASLDLGAERLQLEAVFLSALLQYTKRIANSFACILVLSGFDDLLNEFVLLGSQADVPSWHLPLRISAMAKIANRCLLRPGGES